MKVAYCINNNGEKVEISAYDNNCMKYTGRLICPCCCGQVDPYLEGKKQGKHFRHHHGSYRKECEDYCKSISITRYIQPYERAGLPLYLVKEFGTYSLALGLYGLDERTIDEAENLNLELEIELDKNNKIKRKINNQYFIPYKMNFIKINTAKQQYKLNFNSKIVPSEIKKKWILNINGIGINGAIFYSGDYGGKKVSSSIGIKVNEEYLLLTNINMNKKQIQGFSFAVIQEINFGWLNNYRIYKFIIREINKETIGFCDKYDMQLQYNQPEIVPVWPPCTIVEHELIYQGDSDKYFILNADNEKEKDIYSHILKQRLISSKIDGSKYLSRNPIKADDFISIGNLQNQFIFSITKRKALENVTIPKIHVQTKSEKVIINTKSKIFINYFKNDVLLKSEIIKKESTNNLEIEGNKRIDVLYGLDVIWSKVERLKDKIAGDNQILDRELLYKIERCRGLLIAKPDNFKWMALKQKKYPQSYKVLQKIMKNDRVSVELINLLKTLI